MGYTVRELIDTLENYPDDAEVRLAFQPRHPLQYQISDVKSANDLKEEGDEDEEAESLTNGKNGGESDAPDVVYLLEGRQEGYASSKLWGEDDF